jgi:predicted RNase H-like HicB family nuclease
VTDILRDRADTTININQMKDVIINIIIEKDRDGYYAYSPDLKGCQSQGTSLEEVKANIQEAVELYLETLDNLEIQAICDRDIFTMALEVKVA